MRVTLQTKQATEQAIRRAAHKLFTDKGFSSTSTREIASDAQIAVGTLFNYFPSKEALALALAADAFGAGRAIALDRLAQRPASMEEELFTLIASDVRALESIRSFVADVLDAAFSPFATPQGSPDGAAIRTQRLDDAAAVLVRHGFVEAVTPAVMHLYWSLYVGVLSYWTRDLSPKQEDTWALLDQGVRMFAGALRRPDSTSTPREPGLTNQTDNSSPHTPGAFGRGKETHP